MVEARGFLLASYGGGEGRKADVIVDAGQVEVCARDGTASGGFALRDLTPEFLLSGRVP